MTTSEKPNIKTTKKLDHNLLIREVRQIIKSQKIVEKCVYSIEQRLFCVKFLKMSTHHQKVPRASISIT